MALKLFILVFREEHALTQKSSNTVHNSFFSDKGKWIVNVKRSELSYPCLCSYRPWNTEQVFQAHRNSTIMEHQELG